MAPITIPIIPLRITYLKMLVPVPQNWGVAQDKRGIMYFCNESGILEYDGVRFTMVKGTENLTMNKAVCGADGRIYTGGENEFGYLGQGKNAEIEFVSLTHLLPDSLNEFGKILMVQSIGDSLAFMSYHYLFIYHNDSVVVHPKEEGYLRVLIHNEKLLVQLSKTGLCEIRNGEFIPLHQDKISDGKKVRYMCGSDSVPFLFCNKQGILKLENEELVHHPSTFDTLFIWNGNSLNDQTHVIGSNELGALIFNNQSEIKEIFSFGVRPRRSIGIVSIF